MKKKEVEELVKIVEDSKDGVAEYKTTKQQILDYLDNGLKVLADFKTRPILGESFYESLNIATVYSDKLIRSITSPSNDDLNQLFNNIYDTGNNISILDTLICNKVYLISNGNIEDYITHKYIMLRYKPATFEVDQSSKVNILKNVRDYIDRHYDDLFSTESYSDRYYDSEDDDILLIDDLEDLLNSNDVRLDDKLFIVLRLLCTLSLSPDGLNDDQLIVDTMNPDNSYPFIIAYINSISSTEDDLYKSIIKLSTITAIGLSGTRIPVSGFGSDVQYNVYRRHRSLVNYNNLLTENDTVLINAVINMGLYMTGILSTILNQGYRYSMIKFNTTPESIDVKLQNIIHDVFYTTGSFISIDRYLGNDCAEVSLMSYILACTLYDVDTTTGPVKFSNTKLASVGNIMLPYINHNIVNDYKYINPTNYDDISPKNYIIDRLLVNINSINDVLTIYDITIDYLATIFYSDNINIKSLARLISSKNIINLFIELDDATNGYRYNEIYTCPDILKLLTHYKYISPTNNVIPTICSKLLELCDIECILLTMEALMEKYKNKVSICSSSGLAISINSNNKSIEFDPYEINELYIICKNREVFKRAIMKKI